MKRIATNAFICLLLSGCTFNQYGPSVVIKEKDLDISQSINLEQIKEKGGSEVIVTPVTTASEKKQVTSTVISRVKPANCVPMPVLKDPPKINLEELKKHMNDEKELAKIFKANHSQLFEGWKRMKKEIEEWQRDPNRC